ncbi:MAG: Bug family tripartite tricarboxylate transporter substrate binding protein [Betaproteobacteria bacterium]
MTLRFARALCALFAFYALASGLARPAVAQEFPSRPIRIIVGQGAGGGMDTIARLVGQRMTSNLGQPIVVENRTGAGGMIATETVARAPADGYTLLLGPIGNMVFTPILSNRMRVSTTADFAPVSLVATFPLVLVVSSTAPIQSVKDLVDWMKANPAKANFGGSGPAFRFANELFKVKTGAPGEFIQYKSMTETITALIAGDLVMSMVDTGPATPQISAGKLRALAVTSPARLAALPEVPTMAELGFAEIEFRFWTGLFAPAGTPPAVIRRLGDELARALALPEVGAQMAALQVQPQASSPEELGQLVQSDLIRWGQVAETARIPKSD